MTSFCCQSTKSSAFAQTEHVVLPSVRTGDLLLYNDESASIADGAGAAKARADAFKYSAAKRLTKLLLALPCFAYFTLLLDDAVDYDDDLLQIQWSQGNAAYARVRSAGKMEKSSGDSVVDDDDEDVCAMRALRHEWLHWQHAALIVCLDVTPFVFVPDQRQREKQPTRAFALVPLHAFLQTRNAQTYAVRHLMIAGEDRVENYRSHSCARRANLAKLFHKAHALIVETPPTLAGADMLRALLSEPPLWRPQSPQAPSFANVDTYDTLAVQPAIDYRLAFKSSIAYTTLYTLYLARVLRTEPRLQSASLLVQSVGALQQCMNTDYRYTRERLFTSDWRSPIAPRINDADDF